MQTTRGREEVTHGDSTLVEQPPPEQHPPGDHEPLDQYFRWLWR